MAMSAKAYACRLGNQANLRGYLLSDWRRCISTDSSRHKAATVALRNPIDVQKNNTAGNKHASSLVFDPTEPDPANSRIDSDFQNAQEAFKSKTTSELLRALLVFNLCSIRPLVDYNKQVREYN